jgi:hypothetical protein
MAVRRIALFRFFYTPLLDEPIQQLWTLYQRDSHNLMRLLTLFQGNTPEDQIGYHTGFETLLAEGVLTAYRPLAWLGLVNQLDWEGFCSFVLKEAMDFTPDAIYFQFFHAPDSPALKGLIASLRRLPNMPVIAISGGDAFGWHRWMKHRFPEGFLRVANSADVTFVTAMGKCAAYLERRGVKNIVILPLGACQVRFKPMKLAVSDYGSEFDVVFLGRFNRCRDPRSFLFYYDLKRKKLVNLLSRRYGKRFGLFGPGWSGQPSWQGTVPYSEQLDCCRKSQVVFGGTPGIYQDYYASDRPFIQGISGVPMVDWYVPRLNHLLRTEEHWHLVNNSESMIKVIDKLLESDPEILLKRSAATADYIFANLSQVAMMRFLVATLRQLREACLSGKAAPAPDIPFFLSEVNVEHEKRFAIRNWIG